MCGFFFITKIRLSGDTNFIFQMGQNGPLFGIILQGKIKSIIWRLYYFLLIKIVPMRYKRLSKRLRRKERIVICFLIQLASSWKYDYLYRLFSDDERFEPIIVICPIANYEEEMMFDEMQAAFNFFIARNYRVISSWDISSNTWIDVKDTLRPDIVFFSNPWAELSRKEYYILNFLDTLTCYAPYGFKSSHLYEAIFNKPFQNLLWRIFYESVIHKSMAEKHGRNKGVNGIVTGYPGMDNLLDKNYSPVDVWTINARKLKRIIWAPHHSIFGKDDSKVGFSTFTRYSTLMVEIANQYKDEVQFSFKPHPLLKSKLYKHPEWGKEKTDRYYDLWAEMSNTQIDEGNYIDLFMTSDAIINDGESFMVEYLYTNKPSLFLIADENVSDRLNIFGEKVLRHLYQAKSDKDIHEFIRDIVIDGNDYLKESRISFFNEYVRPPNNRLASENIYWFIKETVT